MFEPVGGAQPFPSPGGVAAEEWLPLLLGGCSPPGAAVWTASEGLRFPSDGSVTGHLGHGPHTAISVLAAVLLAPAPHKSGSGHHGHQAGIPGQISGQRIPGSSLSHYPFI